MYHKAYQDLYENLIILGEPEIGKDKYSLINHPLNFKVLRFVVGELPAGNYANKSSIESRAIIDLLVVIAWADGKIDSNEDYNLGESIRGLSHALNINLEDLQKDLENAIKRIGDFNDSEKRQFEFKKTCEQLKDSETSISPRTVIDLCRLVAGSNDDWNESEVKLFDIAKEVFDL